MWYVYFLQLHNGDIYVGSTNDLRRSSGFAQAGRLRAAGRDVLLRDEVVGVDDAYAEASARLTGLVFGAEAVVDEEGVDCLDAILTAAAESWGGGARGDLGAGHADL